MEAHARDFGIEDLDSYVGPHEDLLRREREGNLVCLLAEAAGSAVGYLGWHLGRHQGLNCLVGHMGPWYIAPSARGRGLAKRMLEKSFESLKYRGAKFAIVVMPLRGRQRSAHPLLGRPFEMTYLVDLFKRSPRYGN